MSFERTSNYITPQERNDYLTQLQLYMQTVMPAGAVSDETEAQRLYRRLLQGEQIERQYVEKIIGQLGDSDDRGSLYH